MAKAARLYFENNLDVPLWLMIVATEDDLELHVYDHLQTGAVYIPANRTASHEVTPAIERFVIETVHDDGTTKRGMDYWLIPHIPTVRKITTNDTRNPAGKVNQPDGPVISFYPFEN